MIFPVTADLIGLIKGIVDGLQPFARAHGINLNFSTEYFDLIALYQPEEIVPDITKLICRVITFTPQGYAVEILINVTSEEEVDHMSLSVVNTGVSLALLGDIRAGLQHEVLMETRGKGTSFTIKLPIHHRKATQLYPPEKISKILPGIKPWYSEIRKRLTTHFQDPRNLELAAESRSEKEAMFLKKVNAIIDGHLDQESFTTDFLARAMALSRTQLFRKIRLLTQMAPGRYIRFVRLLKARDLLQSGDFNVGEVAGKVGFISNSHFTRAFKQQFGFNPSSVK